MSKQIQIPSKIIPGENSIIYDNFVVENDIYILHGYENSVQTHLLVLDYNTYKLKNKFNFDNCYHGIFYKNKIYVLKGHNVLAYDMFTLNLLNTTDLSKFEYFDFFHEFAKYGDFDDAEERFREEERFEEGRFGEEEERLREQEERFREQEKKIREELRKEEQNFMKGEERFRKEEERKMTEMGILSKHRGEKTEDNPRGIIFNENELNPLNSCICVFDGGLYVCSVSNKFSVFSLNRKVFSDMFINGEIYNHASIYYDSNSALCITSTGTYFYSSGEEMFGKLDNSIQNKTNMNNTKPIKISKTTCIINNFLYDVEFDTITELFQLPVQNLKLTQEGYKIHESNKLKRKDKIESGRYSRDGKNEVNNENKHAVCDLIITVSYNHLTPYNLNNYSENDLSVLEFNNNVGHIPSSILQERTGLTEKVLRIPNFEDYLNYVQFNKIDVSNVVNILNITKELNDYDNEYIAYVIAYIVYYNVVLAKNLNGQYEFLNVLYNNNIQQFYTCLSSLVFYSDDFLNKLPQNGDRLSNTILNYFTGLDNYKNPGRLIN